MFLKTPPQQKAMEKAYSATTNVARSKSYENLTRRSSNHTVAITI